MRSGPCRPLVAGMLSLCWGVWGALEAVLQEVCEWQPGSLF